MSTGNGSKQLRRYNVRGALIVISDDGFFATVSEYGNYAYFWSGAGEEFRAFLAKIDTGYLLGKLCGRRSEYDADRTLEMVKRYILERRRTGFFDRDDARKEWDLLDEHSSLEAREWFGAWVLNTSIGDAWEMAVYDYPSDARWFAKRVWPAFVTMLRAELASEKATAGEVVPQ